MSDENSQRILVLAPVGRDADATGELLAKAQLVPHVCRDLATLVEALAHGAAAVFVAEEALFGRDLAGLTGWLATQPPWSDVPFIVLTSHRQDPAHRGLAPDAGACFGERRPARASRARHHSDQHPPCGPARPPAAV